MDVSCRRNVAASIMDLWSDRSLICIVSDKEEGKAKHTGAAVLEIMEDIHLW